MKNIVLFILFSSSFTLAKEPNGYIIKLNNDTLKCYIFQNSGVINGVDIPGLQNEISILTEGGYKYKYQPTEIKGFGIYYKNKPLHFLSIKTIVNTGIKKSQEKWFFMNCINSGKINIYYFFEVVSGYSFGRSQNSLVPYYLIQKNTDNHAVFLEIKRKETYKNFIKNYIPENYAFFESLKDDCKLKDLVEKIKEYNIDFK